MSIRQYYLQKARSYLNACILTLFCLAAFLSACLLIQIRPPFGLAGIPFFVFAYIHFQSFLVYRRKSKESAGVDPKFGQVPFLQCEDLLLAMAPAPALRLLLFHPCGRLAGEIRELEAKVWRWILPEIIDKRVKKKYGIFDSNGKMLAVIMMKGISVDVMLPDETGIGSYDQKTKSGQTLEDGGKIQRVDESSLYTSIFFQKGKKKMARLQIGWLPVEWSQRFSVNTPVLSFEPASSNEEKLMSLAAVARHYEYADH
ncbi:hypothetical protein [Bacillus sp. FJAT-27251]|uniref:hypothetical protein n=1 Tax=Bacillus sp. FJAT-27251 TaxID=1684142 RepID=UPI0006A7A9EA|nr:hypothetical protein [Bacillus sp. FJAT-27251]